jgi:hypothetical protein
MSIPNRELGGFDPPNSGDPQNDGIVARMSDCVPNASIDRPAASAGTVGGLVQPAGGKV